MKKEKRFQKKIEDFICKHCGKEVKGNGFTNHCPNCLWSKHVDKNPGDRKEKCRGMMKPVSVKSTKEGYSIQHQCIDCGVKRSVKSAPEDNFEIILRLSTKPYRV